MHWVNTSLIFVAGLNVGLALLVWLRNPRNKINITFALSVFLLAAWTLGIAMFRGAETEQAALVWTWIQNGAGSLVVVSFFLFSVYFPYQKALLKRWQIILISISIIIVLGVVVGSNAWVEEIRLKSFDNDYLINFWGVAYFNFHFYLYLILAFRNLFKKYKGSQEFVRKQLFFVILFTGIIALFGGIFGAFIPLVMLSTAGPYYLGPYFSLPMLVFLSWFMFLSGKQIYIK